MKNIQFRKDILPHIIAIAVFLLVVIVFFHPVFFENKELDQHDVLQGVGGGKELIDYRQETGKEGLWTNSMFSGMPGYLVNTQFSGNLLQHIRTFFATFIPAPASHVFVAFISFYILLLSFNVRPYLAIGGAIAFGLNSFMVIGLMAGHVWRITSIAYMPLVIAGVHLAYKKQLLKGIGITALGLSLHIRSNHLQMTYYLLLIILIYILIELINALREKELKTFFKVSLILVIPVILAAGTNLARLWTTLEYSQYSTRGKSELRSDENDQSGLDKDYIFQYSNNIFEPLTMAIPNLMGGPTQQSLSRSSNLGKALLDNGLSRKQADDQLQGVPTYWGKQPLTAPYYAGIIIMFFFVCSLFIIEKKYRYWLLSVFIISIVFSWGDNFAFFNNLVFEYLPGYNKFRSVTFTLIMAFIAVPLGAMIGLEKFLSMDRKEKIRSLKYSGYIAGAVFALALIYSWTSSFRGAIDDRLTNLPSWYLDALRADRARLLRLDIFRNLFFAGAAVWIVWSFSNAMVNKYLAYGVISILITLDVALVSSRYISENNYTRRINKAYFSPSPADQKIMADNNEHYRVLNLQNPFNEARTSYFHHSIGGYHGAKLRRYQDLIERHISGEINRFIENARQGKDMFSELPVLNMLNAKYFYFGEEQQGVFENPNALGNAWLISEIIPVGSPDEEIEMLNDIDPSETCIIDTSLFSIRKTNYNSNGKINLIEYRPDYILYEANNVGNAFAVFSEIYYPAGWIAIVNDQPTEIKRVNYILRGVELEPGSNKLEFWFEPDSYYTGNTLSLIFSIMTYMFLGGIMFIEFRKKTKAPEKMG